jgi:solute carrier family 35 protein F1/2
LLTPGSPIDNTFLFVPCCPVGSDVLIGDILVLLGASLYAVSNVCEEYIVKKLSRQEFLGMVGLFGTIISGIQL